MSKARIGDNVGWCPSASDVSPYLQFDLEKLYLICGFQVIQGSFTHMKSYRVHVSPEEDYLNSWNIFKVMTWACLLLLQIKWKGMLPCWSVFRKKEAMHQLLELCFTPERVLSIQRMTYLRDICMRDIRTWHIHAWHMHAARHPSFGSWAKFALSDEFEKWIAYLAMGGGGWFSFWRWRGSSQWI